MEATALAGKMANTIDQSKQLQATYLQHNATLVRLADRARTRGRKPAARCERRRVKKLNRSGVRVKSQKAEVSKCLEDQ